MRDNDNDYELIIVGLLEDQNTHSISDPIINKNIRKIPQMGTTDEKYRKEQPPLYEEKPK